MNEKLSVVRGQLFVVFVAPVECEAENGPPLKQRTTDN
jgi:hypothetical protein